MSSATATSSIRPLIPSDQTTTPQIREDVFELRAFLGLLDLGFERRLHVVGDTGGGEQLEAGGGVRLRGVRAREQQTGDEREAVQGHDMRSVQ